MHPLLIVNGAALIFCLLAGIRVSQDPDAIWELAILSILAAVNWWLITLY